MIAIINYGSGNIQAIGNIYKRLGVPFAVAKSPEELSAAERVVLPGVGAFDQAMHDLDRSGMRQALEDFVIKGRKPILGICVGMQLLAECSEEGVARGLGWVDGEVKKFDRSSLPPDTRLPHMGWNHVEPLSRSPLFEGVDLSTGFYFLHSYYFCCRRVEDRLGVTSYGAPFTSAVQKDNIYGVQFHPEKSHQAGIQLLMNFATAHLIGKE